VWSEGERVKGVNRGGNCVAKGRRDVREGRLSERWEVGKKERSG
jgi:hypothetical protein